MNRVVGTRSGMSSARAQTAGNGSSASSGLLQDLGGELRLSQGTISFFVLFWSVVANGDIIMCLHDENWFLCDACQVGLRFTCLAAIHWIDSSYTELSGQGSVGKAGQY